MDRKRELDVASVVALCTSDSNQRSFTFIRERIERRTAERISHSARCEPRPHRGPIFFFLVDFVCGRVCDCLLQNDAMRAQRTLSLLSFSQWQRCLSPLCSSRFDSLFLSLSFFLPARLSYFLPPLSAELHILLTSAEFYDPPRYIYVSSKCVYVCMCVGTYLHNWKHVGQRLRALRSINYILAI